MLTSNGDVRCRGRRRLYLSGWNGELKLTVETENCWRVIAPSEPRIPLGQNASITQVGKSS
jgi:hypothetical protein